jgi:N-methylhydantoinase A
MPLDKGRAEKAIREHVAKPLGIDVVEAACAISSLVESNMAEMVLLSAVRKGYDPRDFRFVAGGGAGPIHAVPIAFKLGMQQVYIPKLASLFCTLGISLADYKCILGRMLYRREDEVRLDDIKALYQSLEDEGRVTLERQGVPDARMQFIRGAEMRYSGQLHDIEVLLPPTARGQPFTKTDFEALVDAFHARHKAVYGYADGNMPAIFSTLKLQAKGVRPSIELVAEPFSSDDPSTALRRRRQVYSKERGGFIEMPCYDATRLKHGNIVVGPAILEHTQTTILVPEEAELTVDAYGNYSVVRASR